MEAVTASDYYELTSVREPELAPDGQHVFYVRHEPESDQEYTATIHRRSLTDSEDRRLTLTEGVDSDPTISPDGERLAFASTRGDDDRTQLWILPVEGGEAARYTDVPGGVSDLAWSPDGRSIAFTQRCTAAERDADIDLDIANAESEDYERPTPDPLVVDRLVYRSREEREFGETTRHVYRLDLDTEAVSRVTQGDGEHRAPAWGPDGALYYAVQSGPDPAASVEFEIRVFDPAAEETDSLVSTTGYPQSLEVSDAGRIAFPYVDPDRLSLSLETVRVYDVETGEMHRPAASVDRMVEGFEWGPDGGELYLLTPDSGEYAIRAVPWSGGDARVIVHDGHIADFTVGVTGVTYVKSEWDHPGDVFFRPQNGEDTRRLTDVNAEFLSDRTVAEPEPLRFESDGRELQGWLLRPPDAGPERESPLVVQIHGGPHIMWTESGTMWHEFQTLAARGYAVFWCNPRGSGGYGQAFREAIERDWGGVTMPDIMAGVEAAAAKSGVDSGELFVTGGSFGGFMTAWIIGQTNRFEAAVAQRGVYDLTTFYGTSDQVFRLVEGDWRTSPTKEPEFLWEHSPVAHVESVETPTLLIHAEADYRVPISIGELYHRLLRRRREDVRFVRYPRASHDLSRGGEPAHVVDRIERIARWFDGYSSYHDAPPAVERNPDADLSSHEGNSSCGSSP